MTTFPCPSCGKTIAAEVPAGSSVTCPLCNAVVTIPGAAAAAPPPAFPPTQTTWPVGQVQGPRRGLAIASLVLGILGIFTSCMPVLGLTALILGIIALVKASNRPAEYGGKGLAVAGVSLGGISLVLMPVMFMMIAIMLPSLSKARDMAKRAVCAANLGGTGKGLAIYANQYKGQLPPDIDALVRSGLAQPGQFVCPASGASEQAIPSYAYSLSGTPISPKLHELLNSCYVYIPGQNDKSNPANVVMYEKKENHHGEGGNVLFADWHVQWIEPYAKVEQLVAKTKARLAEEAAPAESPDETE